MVKKVTIYKFPHTKYFGWSAEKLIRKTCMLEDKIRKIKTNKKI